MSLFFQHPALLGLLALAALPLLVHLLSRAKPPSYQFSNTEFLRKVLRLTSRYRKPKDWLLLILRTLAILAIAAAFLGPLLLSDDAPLPGERRTIVCLVDRSASMAAKQGATSRFEAASAAAAKLLDSARPELANLVWIDASPDATFPDPGPNRQFLAEELTRAAVHPEPNAIEAAFELATRQFPNAEGRRELHVFSDFQQSTWKDIAPTIPSDIDLQLIPVAKGDVANLSVSSLVPVPASPVAGRPLLVQCRVTNHSDEARRVSLTLDAGGSRQSQALDLRPRGIAEAAFSVRLTAPGLMPLSAGIDSDAFPLDDQRHAVVRVRESLRMAIAAAPSDPACDTLSKVAAALPWLDAIPSVDPANPPPCDLLVIPNWSGSSVEKLRALASQNTAILVLPAPGTSLDGIWGTGITNPSPTALQTDAKGWEAAPVSGHPAFKLFADGEFGNPLGGRFRERLNLPDAGPTTVLARFSDGIPALISDPKLPILVSNLSLDPAKSSWPTRSAFLPSIAELVLHLCPNASAESFTTEPGGILAWTDASGDNSAVPVLQSPDGSPVSLISTPSDAGLTWTSESPAIPGLYQWLVSGQPVHFTAVNFPESESNLRPLPEPPTIGAGTTRLADPERLAALDRGLPLWPWLIAAALFFLLIESLITTVKVPSSKNQVPT